MFKVTMYLIQRALLLLSSLFLTMYYRILMKAIGVEGRRIKFQGRISIYAYPGSSLYLGSNSEIRSNNSGWGGMRCGKTIFQLFTANSIIKFGDNVQINGTEFYCRSTSITVGNEVMFAPGCLIMDTDFHAADSAGHMKSSGLSRDKAVFIGDNVWIGVNSTVMKGAVINNNVVVGSNSLVNKELESGWIYAGIPCKKVKKL
jgi:acetyltransferase-like isoleucine patch superfamily enzyme